MLRRVFSELAGRTSKNIGGFVTVASMTFTSNFNGASSRQTNFHRGCRDGYPADVDHLSYRHLLMWRQKV
jgi:hypothetical protein